MGDRRWTVIVAALALGGSACRATASGSVGIAGPVPKINTALPVDDLDDATHASLATCTSGDVAANLAIISDLRQSYHEMIVCGGLAMNFNGALINVLVSAALGHGRGLSGFTYKGNG